MSALRKLLGKGIQGYHPGVARALNSVAAAIFVEHISFWQDKSEDDWAFRTQEEIYERTALGRSAQESSRNLLKEKGILKEKRIGVPARLHYKIDYDNLEAKLQSAETVQTGMHESRKQESTTSADYLSKGVSKEPSKKETVVVATPIEECEPLPDDVTTRSLLLLNDIANFPRDNAKNAIKLMQYREEFPSVDAVEVVEDFVAYCSEKPLKKTDNPRLRLRNFFKSARKRSGAAGQVSSISVHQANRLPRDNADQAAARRTEGYEEFFGPQGELTPEERAKLEEITGEAREDRREAS